MSNDLSSPPETADPLATTPETPPQPVGIGPAGWVRWGWRQLTSMRTALVLLFLLALGSIPGSVLPQRDVDPFAVARYVRENPSLGPWLDRFWLFDVFASPWFSAVYLLLFTSLLGCVLPRTRMHWRAMRARPPATPRNLGRLPVSRRWETDGEPGDVIAATRGVLRAARFRTDSGDSTVSAEKGYLRETGNLLFHTALVVLLVALAAGKLYGFRGNVLVVEGGGFINAASAYDTFDPGTRFSDGQLTPFSVRLDDLAVRYQEPDGAPLEFRADVQWRSEPAAPLRPASISPNHPLVVEGTKVFLLGNGYAPRLTVRDAKGQVTFAGAVPFLPRDGDRGMTSTGVVKVANTVGSDQLGLAATFLPTAVPTPLLGPVSVFPDARVPRLYVTALWRGELGEQANVFRLETDRMTRVAVGDKPYTVELRPGVTTVLPEGLGTVTFDGVSRFASFQVAHDPGRWWALGGALLAIAGLLASLFVRRRRVFVRVTPGGDAGGAARTVVEVGALARTDDGALAGEIDELLERLQERVPARAVERAADGED